MASLFQAASAMMGNPAATAATVGTGTAGVGSFVSFEYSKDNFLTDEGNRFTRFSSAVGYMNTQVGQYRMDIRGLTNNTAGKVHVFIDVCQLFMCTSAALSCAGRIGMHGSAPPGWFCALYSGHIFLGIMYLTTSIWLGMHAQLRAQAGMVSLLTRRVRLPIPSLEQIDQARVIGSSYEKQPWRDIFRVPFMRHPQWAAEVPDASSDEDDAKLHHHHKHHKDAVPMPTKGGDGKSKEQMADDDEYRDMVDTAASPEFGSTGRTTMPTWIRDEQVVDKGMFKIPGMGRLMDDTPHDAPEHFKAFTEAQKTWFSYEIYHRILMLYGVMCFLHAVNYYAVGTAMSELRGFWIAWSLPLVFMTAQAMMLQLDIFKARGQNLLTYVEILGHIAPYFAVVGCTLEYRIYYSAAGYALIWFSAMASFFCHFMFAVRLYNLACPGVEAREAPDLDAQAWWPGGWKVPLAFAENLWMITPPKRLKKGQHDLLHEAHGLAQEFGEKGMHTARRRHFGKDGKVKHSKRIVPQSTRDLMNTVYHIEGRFEHIWPEVTGTDQLVLTKLHTDFREQAAEARRISCHGRGGSDSDDSGPALPKGGSDGYAEYKQACQEKPMSHSEFQTRVYEVGEGLNDTAEGLDELEKRHQVEHEVTEKDLSAPRHPYSNKTASLPELPANLTRIVTGTHAFVWFFMMIATCVEIGLGSEPLLSWPGEPPWIRNQKMRPYKEGNFIHKSSQPLPDYYRLFNSATIEDVEAGEHGTIDNDGHGGSSDHGAGHDDHGAAGGHDDHGAAGGHDDHGTAATHAPGGHDDQDATGTHAPGGHDDHATDAPHDDHATDAPHDDHATDAPHDDHATDAPQDDHATDAPHDDHSATSAPHDDHSDTSHDDHSDTSHDDHSDTSHDAGARRLVDGRASDAVGELLEAMPSLDWLATQLSGGVGHMQEMHETASVRVATHKRGPAIPAAKHVDVIPAVSTDGFMAPSLHTLPVAWPPLFEPHHLVCQPRSTGTAVVALTQRGFGTALLLRNATHLPEVVEAHSFALEGVTTFAPLASVSWGPAGLRLVSQTGNIAHCDGHAPVNGMWRCGASAAGQLPPLPVPHGSRVVASAVSEATAARASMAAVLFKELPTTVVLYRHDAVASAWHPAGEVHLPPSSHAGRVALAVHGEVLHITTADGSVHRRVLRDDVEGLEAQVAAPAAAGAVKREWLASCVPPAGVGSVLRLALRQPAAVAAGASAWKPELVLGA